MENFVSIERFKGIKVEKMFERFKDIQVKKIIPYRIREESTEEIIERLETGLEQSLLSEINDLEFKQEIGLGDAIKLLEDFTVGVIRDSKKGDSNNIDYYKNKDLIQDIYKNGEIIDDGRKEIFEINDIRVREIAESCVLICNHKDIESHKHGSYKLITKTHKENYRDKGYMLADEEPFLNQPAVGFGSGFLVKPDVILTANHNLDYITHIKNARFVFNFKMENEYEATTELTENNIYKGKAVITNGKGGDDDWALIRLDREVVGKQPVTKFRKTGSIDESDEVYCIGHPCHLPMKYTGDAKVLHIKNDYFTTSLDTFSGNSGSIVCNKSNNNQVEGIFASGEDDFKEIRTGFLNLIVRYRTLVIPLTVCYGDENYIGEKCTKIEKAIESIESCK